MKNLTEFVQTLVNSFQIKTRDDGTTFYCVKDDEPEYISDLCYDVHGGMLPDDYIYQFLVEALEYIDDNIDDLTDDLDDIDVYDACDPDYMNSDLLRWVSSNLLRMNYCDEVLKEYQLDQLAHVLMQAQQNERVEVLQDTINWINSQQGILWDNE